MIAALSPAERNPSMGSSWGPRDSGSIAAGPMKVCDCYSLSYFSRMLVDDRLGFDPDQFDLYTSETIDWRMDHGGRVAFSRFKVALHIGQDVFMAEGNDPEAVFERFRNVTLQNAVDFVESRLSA